MKYTPMQQKYLDANNGEIDQGALKIIGVLEKTIKAQSRLLVTYRVGGAVPEWVFEALEKARKIGVEVES